MIEPNDLKEISDELELVKNRRFGEILIKVHDGEISDIDTTFKKHRAKMIKKLS